MDFSLHNLQFITTLIPPSLPSPSLPSPLPPSPLPHFPPSLPSHPSLPSLPLSLLSFPPSPLSFPPSPLSLPPSSLPPSPLSLPPSPLSPPPPPPLRSYWQSSNNISSCSLHKSQAYKLPSQTTNPSGNSKRNWAPSRHYAELAPVPTHPHPRG